jgi:hypothetical protein
MLDYKQMVNSEKLKRNEIISEKIIIDLISALKKYKFPKFELQKFESDLINYFTTNRLENEH